MFHSSSSVGNREHEPRWITSKHLRQQWNEKSRLSALRLQATGFVLSFLVISLLRQWDFTTASIFSNEPIFSGITIAWWVAALWIVSALTSL